MFNFNYNFPTKIHFGLGELDRLYSCISSIGEKPLLICGVSSCYDNGVLDLIKSHLDKNGVFYSILQGVQTNPVIDKIEEGKAIILRNGLDCIVSVGGGSIHDTAKAIAVSVSHEGALADYSVTGAKSVSGISSNLLPIITIPTIYGTGAEVSPAALIRLEDKKLVVFSPFLYPKVCIYDHNLMKNVPSELIAKVGIDAFFQSLEGYVASNAQPLSDAFSLASINNSVKYLPRLIANPDDFEAKQFVSLSAMLSIMTVALSGVGAIHALSDPLSGIYNTHHGVAQLIVAKEVLKYNRKFNEAKYAQVDNLIANVTGIYKSIEEFLLDFPVNLEADIKLINNKGVEIDKLVEDSFNPDMGTNPGQLSKQDIADVFIKSLKP